MVKFFWRKLLSKPTREAILTYVPEIDRGSLNRVLSGGRRLPDDYLRHSCIFIHVPKCAGSSVKAALFTDRTQGHTPLRYYEENFREFYGRAFKFGFVRDPLDRAYSAFRYLHADTSAAGRNAAAHRLARKHGDFDTFVRQWLCAENVQRQIHFVPQWQWLCDSLGDIAVDYVGRQEEMDSAFAHVCQRLGVDAKLPQTNVSPKPKERPQFAAATIDRVRLVYERDYELFGY